MHIQVQPMQYITSFGILSNNWYFLFLDFSTAFTVLFVTEKWERMYLRMYFKNIWEEKLATVMDMLSLHTSQFRILSFDINAEIVRYISCVGGLRIFSGWYKSRIRWHFFPFMISPSDFYFISFPFSLSFLSFALEARSSFFTICIYFFFLRIFFSVIKFWISQNKILISGNKCDTKKRLTMLLVLSF